ncbi:hypothetical protein [Candidatus Amarobacter glycogenicus]|uniref:hypothetical protein n=1 Tax=Candidatus Amarobacter glycogenicus TaxID=3140699 RepID=UPI0031CCC168
MARFILPGKLPLLFLQAFQISNQRGNLVRKLRAPVCAFFQRSDPGSDPFCFRLRLVARPAKARRVRAISRGLLAPCGSPIAQELLLDSLEQRLLAVTAEKLPRGYIESPQE